MLRAPKASFGVLNKLLNNASVFPPTSILPAKIGEVGKGVKLDGVVLKRILTAGCKDGAPDEITIGIQVFRQ